MPGPRHQKPPSHHASCTPHVWSLLQPKTARLSTSSSTLPNVGITPEGGCYPVVNMSMICSAFLLRIDTVIVSCWDSCLYPGLNFDESRRHFHVHKCPAFSVLILTWRNYDLQRVIAVRVIWTYFNGVLSPGFKLMLVVKAPLSLWAVALSMCRWEKRVRW